MSYQSSSSYCHTVLNHVRHSMYTVNFYIPPVSSRALSDCHSKRVSSFIGSICELLKDCAPHLPIQCSPPSVVYGVRGAAGANFEIPSPTYRPVNAHGTIPHQTIAHLQSRKCKWFPPGWCFLAPPTDHRKQQIPQQLVVLY